MGGWGKLRIKTNSVQLRLKLGLSLAIISTFFRDSPCEKKTKYYLVSILKAKISPQFFNLLIIINYLTLYLTIISLPFSEMEKK